jgi:hypothetical protein
MQLLNCSDTWALVGGMVSHLRCFRENISKRALFTANVVVVLSDMMTIKSFNALYVLVTSQRDTDSCDIKCTWHTVYHFSMRLLVVTRYQHFVEKVSEQHGETLMRR